MKPHRKIKEIAFDIFTDWDKPSNCAMPYLEAMMSLNDITDNYYSDSAKMIVTYFLSNASKYKGDKARWYKRELKEMMKDA